MLKVSLPDIPDLKYTLLPTDGSEIVVPTVYDRHVAAPSVEYSRDIADGEPLFCSNTEAPASTASRESPQSDVTTFQFSGQFDAPRAMVELVPSVIGHTKLPLAETFLSQSLVPPASHEVKSTTISERLLQ